jgi:hypothetical protein
MVKAKKPEPATPDIPAECPATIRRDAAHKAICVEACKALEVPQRSKRPPMFSKSTVQFKAGFPNITINCWPEIVEAVERWHWQWAPNMDEGGFKVIATQRATRIQLLGLTQRAFADAHWMMVPPEPDPDILASGSATGHKKAPKKPDVRRITPKDELEALGEEPYPLTETAAAIAQRFIAQNTGKKTAGYGSVEVAKGRLAWRWFETMNKKIKANRDKKTLIEEVLRANGMLPEEIDQTKAPAIAE